MANVFVTGATGMLGANLVRELIKEGHAVKILIRNTNHPFLDGLKLTKIKGDLSDYQSILEGTKECEYVFHCAAIISYNKAHKDSLFQVNVIGTKNVVKAALRNKVKRMIYVSSTAAVGICQRINNSPLNEKSVFNKRFKKIHYMNTKNLSESIVKEGIKQGLNAVIINPSTIIGKGDNKMNSGILFKNIKNNRMKAAPPGGNGFVSVNDCVEGILLAMKNGKIGERYILNTENFDFWQMFNIISNELGSKKIKKILPKWTYYPLMSIAIVMEFINKNSRLTSQVLFFSYQYRYFNSSKAKKEIGWNPKQDFRSAVKEAILFYERENLI